MKKERVFISYARSDGATFAKTLRQDLEKENIPCWQDRQGMEGGRDWWEQIKEALDHVEYMVLVITPAAINSPIIRREWRYARSRGVCVYPIKGVPDKDIDYAALPKPIRSGHFYDRHEEWSKFVNDLNTRCEQIRVPFMVADNPPDLVQRPIEYEEIKRQLIDPIKGDPIAITAALRGAGGFGKTTMARVLCHDEDIQEAFDDGILWVTLGEKAENLQGNVEDLIYILSHERPGFSSLEAATSQLAKLLTDRDILIVIDDVWKAGDARPFLEGGKACARLITTRNSDTLPAKCREITLDAMQQNEAVQLLGFGIEDIFKQHGPLKELADRLGEWPLLLKLVNATLRDRINKNKDTIKNALFFVNKALDKRGLTYFDARNELDRNRAVSSTLQVSLDLLTEEEKSLFHELSIFPEDVLIPLKMVEVLWKSNGLDAFDTEELCRKLFNYSLLLDLDLADQSIRLHDVVRTFLREQIQSTLPVINADFLKNFASKAWHEQVQFNSYLWHYLAFHLNEANRLDELKSLLFDINWLKTKIAVKDLKSLLNDFEYSFDEDCKLLQSGLRLSTNQLLRDPDQLAAHLWGRFQNNPNDCFVDLLDIAFTNKKNRSLYPKSQSLMAPGGPLIRSLEGHSNEITGIALTPDGRRAVSTACDNTLKIWDLASGKLLHSLEGHSDWVHAVALTPDGRQAVSASRDNTLKVWDLASGKLLNSLEGHINEVTAVALTPDGRQAVSASRDNTLKVWDLVSGKLLHSLEAHINTVTAVALTPDGRRAVSASRGNTLKVWDLASGKLLHSLEAHINTVTAVALTPDGRQAVSASEDNTLKVWDLGSGKLLHSLEGHINTVTAVALTPDGRQAVSASEDNTLKVWDLANGKLLHSMEGHSGRIYDVALTPDGRQAVSASYDCTLKVWDLANGKLMHSMEGHGSWVIVVALTPDGRQAVSGSVDANLKVWDLARGKLPNRQVGHSGWVTTIAPTPDGRQAVSASEDNTLKVWDLASGKLLHSLEGHKHIVNTVALTPDGRWVVSASYDKTLKVWDLVNGKLLHSLEDRSDSITVTPDGRQAVSASWKSLKVWDLFSGKLLNTLGGHSNKINAVALTPDGRWAVSAAWDNTLKIWDLASGKLLHSLEGHNDWVHAVALTPDGRRVVSASYDKTLKVWDLVSGKLLHSLRGHSDKVCAVALTPDGRRVVSASYDKTLKVWDLTSGKLLHSLVHRLEGHSDWVHAVALTPDGRQAVSSSDGCSVVVWDLSIGKMLCRFIGDSPINSIAVTKNTIIAAEESGLVHFLELREPK